MISEQSQDSQHQPTNLNSLQAHPIQFQQQVVGSETLTDEVFSLLEERLIVNLSKHKIGEIVVRKEIDTQILQVEVPVRREKLIVEQVSPEYKLLAQIDLGQEHSSAPAIADSLAGELQLANNGKKAATPITLPNHVTQPTVAGEIDSLAAASKLLTEIANLPATDWETVRIEIVLKDATQQDRYQVLFDRYCHKW